jgi:uncharacterized protein YaaR (DUF327 family)
MNKIKEFAEEILNLEAKSNNNAQQVESAYSYIEAIGNRLGIEHGGDWVTLIKGIDDKLTEFGFPQTSSNPQIPAQRP